ncbi:4'-phosphopantetheinyl transferase family protein [Streptosporangium sp. OZ121]|uniref:4'-phosphopantetheinyl transferase family protein n=1 Tax=Streptosporangium sp. OZ121 TaxID=3444183 RepID=UPI003F7AC581
MSTVLVFDIDRLSDAGTDRFRQAVPAERRARADRFHFPEDRKRCLAAGVLLRYALLERHGLPVRDLVVARNEFGKPFLVNRPGLHFNLSHSGRWVACATSATEIGVDIEHTSAGAVDIAHRFTPDEHAYISAAPAGARARRLVQIWTLKESYVKYLGRGLNVPLNSFSVSARDRRPKVLRGRLDTRPFLKQVTHEGDYWIAECSENKSDISLAELSPEDLLAVC